MSADSTAADTDSAADSGEGLSESQPEQTGESADDADRVLDDEAPVDGPGSTPYPDEERGEVRRRNEPREVPPPEEELPEEQPELQDGVDGEDQDFSGGDDADAGETEGPDTTDAAAADFTGGDDGAD